MNLWYLGTGVAVGAGFLWWWLTSKGAVRPGRILIIGDSLWARGAHIDYLNDLPSPWSVDNQSVVGQSTVSELDRARQIIRPGYYKTVIIAGGANDLGFASADAIIGRLQEMYRLARRSGATVVLATIPAFQGHVSWNRERENKALVINRAIKSIPFTQTVNYRAILGNPLQREYDGGDHLHINRAGQTALIPRLEEIGFKP